MVHVARNASAAADTSGPCAGDFWSMTRHTACMAARVVAAAFSAIIGRASRASTISRDRNPVGVNGSL